MFATIGHTEDYLDRREKLLEAKRKREAQARQDRWHNEVQSFRRHFNEIESNEAV